MRDWTLWTLNWHSLFFMNRGPPLVKPLGYMKGYPTGSTALLPILLAGLGAVAFYVRKLYIREGRSGAEISTAECKKNQSKKSLARRKRDGEKKIKRKGKKGRNLFPKNDTKTVFVVDLKKLHEPGERATDEEFKGEDERYNEITKVLSKKSCSWWGPWCKYTASIDQSNRLVVHLCTIRGYFKRISGFGISVLFFGLTLGMKYPGPFPSDGPLAPREAYTSVLREANRGNVDLRRWLLYNAFHGHVRLDHFDNGSLPLKSSGTNGDRALFVEAEDLNLAVTVMMGHKKIIYMPDSPYAFEISYCNEELRLKRFEKAKITSDARSAKWVRFKGVADLRMEPGVLYQ